MSKDLILKGLQQNAKSLEDSGRVRVATNFACVISSFIADRFKAYFVTTIDETTGKRIRKTVIPTEFDGEGNPIAPEGAYEVGTIRVVLTPITDKGEKGEPVTGFILESSVRGLPAGVNPVNMLASATGVEAVRKNGEHAGELGYFISGLDIDSTNPAVLAYHTAKLGGGLFSLIR